MRLGLAQMDIVWENIEENKKKVIEYMDNAKERQVELIVFPEMTMTGFSMNTSMARYYDEILSFFCQTAKRYAMGIVFGVIAKGEEDRFENRLIMVDDQGKKLMEYTKIHPFSFGAESKYYCGGDELVSCRWKNIDFSGFICYDLRFPYIFQLASEESQVIFVIANWPKERIDHWDALLRARAIEDCCFVVGVNRSGRAGSLQYTGHSAVYDYCGKRLNEIYEDDALRVVDIDTDKVAKYREYFPAVRDRRPEVYDKLRGKF